MLVAEQPLIAPYLHVLPIFSLRADHQDKDLVQALVTLDICSFDVLAPSVRHTSTGKVLMSVSTLGVWMDGWVGVVLCAYTRQTRRM